MADKSWSVIASKGTHEEEPQPATHPPPPRVNPYASAAADDPDLPYLPNIMPGPEAIRSMRSNTYVAVICILIANGVAVGLYFLSDVPGPVVQWLFWGAIALFLDVALIAVVAYFVTQYLMRSHERRFHRRPGSPSSSHKR